MASATLLPDGDVSTGWNEGTGNTFEEINEGVSTPNDADYIEESADGIISRFTMEGTPGDFGSTTSLSIRVRHRADGWTDDLDHYFLRVYDNADALVGVQKNGNHSETMQNQTFTDGNWDSMTQAQIDGMKIEVEYNKNATGMPDGGTIKIFEIDVILGYNLSAGGMVPGGLAMAGAGT